MAYYTDTICNSMCLSHTSAAHSMVSHLLMEQLQLRFNLLYIMQNVLPKTIVPKKYWYKV